MSNSQSQNLDIYLDTQESGVYLQGVTNNYQLSIINYQLI